jgi:LPS sulfotransferase NodH
MHEPVSPFILFAHARSGSNNLAACLNAHPAVRVAEEPFHEKYSVWHPGQRNYNQFIVDIPTLLESLHEIFSTYNGIKILDYQLSEALYTHLLRMPDYRLIFLRRRNLLEAVVSGLIAEQTAVWRASDLQAGNRESYSRLTPLPIKDVRDRLNYAREIQDYYRRIALERHPTSTLFVDYEDLYTTDVSHNLAILSEICAFVGISPPNSDAVDEYINPKRARISNMVRYDALPNFTEINQALGSDTTGWLGGVRLS